MTYRAVETLKMVDVCFAEDTRVTRVLFDHYNIHTKLECYQEHNKETQYKSVLNYLAKGISVALVSYAGMPIISDPGEDLTLLCHENNINICAVPGPCAFVTALAVSGMPSGRFTFEGFLTMNKPGRRAHLAELKTEKRTMIFYEAPHKLIATLRDMLDFLGDREIALVRELTKIHEEVIHTTLSGALKTYSEKEPKGEFVIIVSGAKETEKTYTLEEAVALAKDFIEKGDSTSSAAKKAAEITGLKKGDIYKGML
jgi:16S rRNA (cytidine1402-2'-O)-methyltransferase